MFPIPEEEDSSISSGSFNFSFPSSSPSSYPPSSPVFPGPLKEEEEKEAEKERENKKGEKGEQGDSEEWEEKKAEQEKGWKRKLKKQEQPASKTSRPPQRPQRSMARSTSVEGPSNQDNEDTSSLQTSADPESRCRDRIDKNVTNLVRIMILRYRLRKPITKAQMLQVISKRGKRQFPVIFKKACKCLEVICGIDVKEVVPATHSYVLVNSLDLTYDEMLGDHESMPKNGLLIIILGMIFLEGNCAQEEAIWEFLNMMGVYAGREHFIYGEPRKLLTRTWVQENYLEYQQVLHSDPPHYQFRWGPRAHAETSKLQVLEFLSKIKGIDHISFSCWYEEALRDEQERAQARIGPVGHAAAKFMAQPLLPQLKNEKKS